jgi:hypothetical protein
MSKIALFELAAWFAEFPHYHLIMLFFSQLQLTRELSAVITRDVEHCAAELLQNCFCG